VQQKFTLTSIILTFISDLIFLLLCLFHTLKMIALQIKMPVTLLR